MLLSKIWVCFFSGCFLSLCKATPDLLHGLPEWGRCWNTRSADLHLLGLVETAGMNGTCTLRISCSAGICQHESISQHKSVPQRALTFLRHRNADWGWLLYLCAFVPWLIAFSLSLLFRKKWIYPPVSCVILFLNITNSSFLTSQDSSMRLMKTKTRDGYNYLLVFFLNSAFIVGAFSCGFQLIFNYTHEVFICGRETF